jgi:glucose dehydrogenase
MIERLEITSRAYDKATGAVLWQTDLPDQTTGAPMTYRQYIVVAVGSAPPQLVALSL